MPVTLSPIEISDIVITHYNVTSILKVLYIGYWQTFSVEDEIEIFLGVVAQIVSTIHLCCLA